MSRNFDLCALSAHSSRARDVEAKTSGNVTPWPNDHQARRSRKSRLRNDRNMQRIRDDQRLQPGDTLGGLRLIAWGSFPKFKLLWTDSGEDGGAWMEGWKKILEGFGSWEHCLADTPTSRERSSMNIVGRERGRMEKGRRLGSKNTLRRWWSQAHQPGKNHLQGSKVPVWNIARHHDISSTNFSSYEMSTRGGQQHIEVTSRR